MSCASNSEKHYPRSSPPVVVVAAAAAVVVVLAFVLGYLFFDVNFGGFPCSCLISSRFHIIWPLTAYWSLIYPVTVIWLCVWESRGN